MIYIAILLIIALSLQELCEASGKDYDLTYIIVPMLICFSIDLIFKVLIIVGEV